SPQAEYVAFRPNQIKIVSDTSAKSTVETYTTAPPRSNLGKNQRQMAQAKTVSGGATPAVSPERVQRAVEAQKALISEMGKGEAPKGISLGQPAQLAADQMEYPILRDGKEAATATIVKSGKTATITRLAPRGYQKGDPEATLTTDEFLQLRQQ